MAAVDSIARSASIAQQNPASAAALAGTFCSVFEWFDLILGGVIANVVLRQQTPPTIYYSLFTVTPILALLLGAAVTGGFGDRVGRKAALLATLVLMSLSSLLLGLVVVSGFSNLPTLLALRLVQGAAVGGAYAGCICLPMEWANQGEKGRFAAWPQIGVPAGFALAHVSIFFLSTCLWLACLASGVIGLVSAGFLWRSAAETPAFIDNARNPISSSPVATTIRQDYKEIVLAAGVRTAEIVAFFTFTGFVLAYPPVRHALPYEYILMAVLFACLIAVVSIPIFGRLSDRFGQATIFASGALAAGLWAFAYITLLNAAVPTLTLGVIAVSLVPYAMMTGPEAALIAESFVTTRRYSGCSLGAQSGAAAAGLLLTQFNSGYAIAWLLLGCSYMSAFAALALRQTEIARKLQSASELAIEQMGIDATEIAKFSVPDLFAKALGNKFILDMLQRSLTASARYTGRTEPSSRGASEAQQPQIAVAGDGPEPADHVLKRSLNAWIDSPAPTVGNPFRISINIGASTGAEFAATAFVEPDWRGIDFIELIVSVSSINCAVEPSWRELKLERTGESDMLDFIVTAGLAGKHEFTIRVYLAKQMIRLQSLSFTIEVWARSLKAAEAAS